MLYAMVDDSTGTVATIVAAADEKVEFDAFYARMQRTNDGLFLDAAQPTTYEMWSEDRFVGFSDPPFVFTHADNAQRDAFITANGIKPVHVIHLRNLHNAMMSATLEDQYLSPKADTTPLGKVYGLDKVDRWDKRTPEQQEHDKVMQQKAEEAKKSGKLTSDSFAPPKPDKDDTSDARLTRVETSIDSDGNIQIDNALAVKGFYDDNQKTLVDGRAADTSVNPALVPNTTTAVVADAEPDEHFYRFNLEEQLTERLVGWWLTLLDVVKEGYSAADYREHVVREGEIDNLVWFDLRGRKLANQMAGLLDGEEIAFRATLVDAAGIEGPAMERDDALAQEINPSGIIGKYFRVDFIEPRIWGGLSKVLELLDAGLIKKIAARGQTKDVIWLACATEAAADAVKQTVIDEDVNQNDYVEIYGVNDRGIRLLPKGSSTTLVSEATAVEPPRPWNNRAGELLTMTEEERIANAKTLKGDSFYFTGDYKGAQNGSVLYVVPKSYFDAHGVLYDQPLDIDFLIPADFKEVSPGRYRSFSRDAFEPVIDQLSNRGMTEHLGINLVLNNTASDPVRITTFLTDNEEE